MPALREFPTCIGSSLDTELRAERSEAAAVNLNPHSQLAPLQLSMNQHQAQQFVALSRDYANLWGLNTAQQFEADGIGTIYSDC
jgi:hypothetical protein